MPALCVLHVFTAVPSVSGELLFQCECHVCIRGRNIDDLFQRGEFEGDILTILLQRGELVQRSMIPVLKPVV